MKQMSLARTAFELIIQHTHKRDFFDKMRPLILWTEWLALIASAAWVSGSKKAKARQNKEKLPPNSAQLSPYGHSFLNLHGGRRHADLLSMAGQIKK